jgi:sec-independent protein translocase protein TatA
MFGHREKRLSLYEIFYVSNMLNTILLFALGTGEIILIAFVVLLIFGGKKIPELMRGIGKGVNQFKKGMNDLDEEIKSTDKPENK